MRIRWIRFRKKYRLKGRLFILIIFLLCFILIPRSNRAFIVSFFSSKCVNYQQVYSHRLKDRIIDYFADARLTGIGISSDANAIEEKVSTGQLFRVRGGRFYKIEKMTHSFPYLTKNSRKLLNETGKRFRKKISREGFKGSRFIVTSMTRTSETIKNLGQTNANVSENSPHLYGNAFDISYAGFSLIKLHVTECDKWYLKEALAEVICQLKEEGKCWATYERQQGCFHVVAR
jgi:uncharacterized protein YcbK (DUF882 family)